MVDRSRRRGTGLRGGWSRATLGVLTLGVLIAVLVAAVLTVTLGPLRGERPRGEAGTAGTDPRIARPDTGDDSAHAGCAETFEFELESASVVDVVAGWSGGGSVNLYLRRDGAQVAFANSSSVSPQRLSYEAEPGLYNLAVMVASGSAVYEVDVTAMPVGVEVEDDDGPSAPPEFVPAYVAQPRAGTVIWGSSVQGNGDPYARHEQHVGVPLAVRRTFFTWNARAGGMVNMARGDVAAGRLPWVSVKTPSWAAMAAGHHDGEIDQMLRALDAIDGPVWLTIHHEPEAGSGVRTADDPAGPEGHVGMNRRVRERMDALGVDNVALVPVFMAWTFNPLSGRDIDAWWDEGIYDLLGVDIYQRGEASKVTQNWLRVRAWAADRGVDVAVGEWGMRGTDGAAGQRVHEWYDHAIGSADDGRGARVVALSAFDSGLNSPTGSWELRGEQLKAFHELLQDPRTARAPKVVLAADGEC